MKSQKTYKEIIVLMIAVIALIAAYIVSQAVNPGYDRVLMVGVLIGAVWKLFDQRI